VLKLWITSRAWSSDLNAIYAICGTDIRCADHKTICDVRHRTTDPVPRRMIRKSLSPSSGVRSRTDTHSAIPASKQSGPVTRWTRHPQRSRSRH
jgi:hypothetical protein